MDSSFFFGTIFTLAIYTLLGIIFLIVYRKLNHQENKTIPSPLPPTLPSSSSSSLPRNRKHHVFPSFRGEDVRKSFLSHIKKEFKRKGIDIFIDDEMKRGKSIGPELIEAIRGSKVAIVFLSRNYASSSWCMDELVEIMKCREEWGQKVLTFFYDVDPSDVKKQTGDFGKSFKKTCKSKTKEDIGRWIHALAEVAKIAGYSSSKCHNEAERIEEMTNDVSNMLNFSTPSSDSTGFVGMEDHMEKLERRLCLDETEVRMIGILGPSGIGKTTIARFLFNKYSERFDLTVFMENVKGYTRPGCSDGQGLKMHLQQQFLSKIFNQKDIAVPHLGVAQDRLKDKKVLAVFDDVDQAIQLDAMAKETQWFGPGSRIIITTQDKRLLKAFNIENIQKVDFPSQDELYQTFCMNAFGKNSPNDGFDTLVWEALHFAGIHPSGIRGTGSSFRGMSKQEWTDELQRLRTKHDYDVSRIERFGYRINRKKRKVLSRITSRMKRIHVAVAASDAASVYERHVKEFCEKKIVE